VRTAKRRLIFLASKEKELIWIEHTTRRFKDGRSREAAWPKSRELFGRPKSDLKWPRKIGKYGVGSLAI
jgi:hypothetical protein